MNALVLLQKIKRVNVDHYQEKLKKIKIIKDISTFFAILVFDKINFILLL